MTASAVPSHLELGNDDEFRRAFRDFLSEHPSGKPPKQEQERLAHAQTWWRGAFDAGWAAPALPRAWGGMELPFARQLIYAEESTRARVPGFPGTGLGIAAPTLVRYASPEQQSRWLRPMMRADVVWAQGYSEPEAGSDLPALRTTARREGDHYIVSGQKVWSTQAQVADVLYTLVRTGAQASRQAGITYLVIDLHAPGVTVRQLRDLTGGASFGEVFLDEVRVPVTDRVGEEGMGWNYARTSLGHERAAGSLTQAAFYRRVADELHGLARERGLWSDIGWRRRLGAVEAEVQLLGLSALRTVEHIQQYDEPGPTSSLSRLQITLFEQRLHELALDMLGTPGVLIGAATGAPQRGRWAMGYLKTRASTIGAGTSEIQRNTIAEQVLGLPRDPAMPRR